VSSKTVYLKRSHLSMNGKGYEDWNSVVIIRTGHWNNGAQFYFQMNLHSRYDSIEEPGSGCLSEKSTIQLTILEL
jgi:hypothetical protein